MSMWRGNRVILPTILYNCCSYVMKLTHTIKYTTYSPTFFLLCFLPWFFSDKSSFQSLSDDWSQAILFGVSRKQPGQRVLNQTRAGSAYLLCVGLISLGILAYIQHSQYKLLQFTAQTVHLYHWQIEYSILSAVWR